VNLLITCYSRQGSAAQIARGLAQADGPSDTPE